MSIKINYKSFWILFNILGILLIISCLFNFAKLSTLGYLYGAIFFGILLALINIYISKLKGIKNRKL